MIDINFISSRSKHDEIGRGKMSNISIQTLESLISISANGDNFYALASTLQSLYISLQESCSTKCEDNYVRLMAHFLEKYLEPAKLLFLRQRLAEMIARQTQDDYAAHYFKQRFAHTQMLELLQHHHNLTGKWLSLTHVNYDHQKFKLKQV